MLDDFPGIRFPWYGRMSMDIWIPLKQWVYKRDNGTCKYCLELATYETTHCHHIFPLGEGGTNHPSNLRTVCENCHKKRHPFMLNDAERLKDEMDTR